MIMSHLLIRLKQGGELHLYLNHLFFLDGEIFFGSLSNINHHSLNHSHIPFSAIESMFLVKERTQKRVNPKMIGLGCPKLAEFCINLYRQKYHPILEKEYNHLSPLDGITCEEDNLVERIIQSWKKH
jgi:hypothetical protein